MWWTMVSLTALVGVVATATKSPIPCEEARLKCAFRVGCGKALNHYIMGCSGVLQGPYAKHCPEACEHSLIALTSTEEGKELMECECSDEYCFDAKARVEVCRHPVMLANRKETVVSCVVAQWICAADALCSKALEYYNDFCRSMFHGKKCSHRCLNSISILMRQEKAAKLSTCKCDGREDYDCPRIQNNMARLCFHKKVEEHPHHHAGNTDTNVIKDSGSTASGPFVGVGVVLLGVVALVAVT